MSIQIKTNNEYYDTFIDEFKGVFDFFDETSADDELNELNSGSYITGSFLSDYSGYDDSVSDLISEVASLISSIREDKNSFYEKVVDSFQLYTNAQSSLNEEASKLIDSSSINIDNSSYSGLSSNAAFISSGIASSNSDKSIFSSSDSKMKDIHVDDLIIGMLASFGVTKENFGSISKSEGNGYVVSMKNPNSDGNWNATDIKKYYIKDGKVIGVLTGNDTYIKVEDGKLIIDDTNKSIYSSAIVTGVGGAGSFFATKSNYHTDSNKEIFKKFYPNATDEEFNNFCDSIEKNGENYETVSQKLIESNKDNIVNVFEKQGKNNLTIEDNAIKIDYKPISTELYAYESSKHGISYTNVISNELVFNESTANDLVVYLKDNYSIDVDVSRIYTTS